MSTAIANPDSSLETQPSDDEYGDLNSNRKRSIKGFGHSKKWDKSITKVKRMRGEEYLGYRRDRKVSGNEKFKVLHDIPRPSRETGSRCTSTFCIKSKVRGCSNLSDDERQNIFSKFWKGKEGHGSKGNSMLCLTFYCAKKKQIKNTVNSRMTDSKQYFLSTSIGRIQVCMQTFLKTLG